MKKAVKEATPQQSTFEYRGETRTFGQIKYQEWLSIFDKLAPAIDSAVAARDLDVRKIVFNAGEALPEIALPILQASRPEREFTLEEINEHGDPFTLTEIVTGFAGFAQVIPKTQKLLQTLSELVKASVPAKN